MGSASSIVKRICPIPEMSIRYISFLRQSIVKPPMPEAAAQSMTIITLEKERGAPTNSVPTSTETDTAIAHIANPDIRNQLDGRITVDTAIVMDRGREELQEGMKPRVRCLKETTNFY